MGNIDVRLWLEKRKEKRILIYRYQIKIEDWLNKADFEETMWRSNEQKTRLRILNHAENKKGKDTEKIKAPA